MTVMVVRDHYFEESQSAFMRGFIDDFRLQRRSGRQS